MTPNLKSPIQIRIFYEQVLDNEISQYFTTDLKSRMAGKGQGAYRIQSVQHANDECGSP